jgi:hypothetical protein
MDDKVVGSHCLRTMTGGCLWLNLVCEGGVVSEHTPTIKSAGAEGERYLGLDKTYGIPDLAYKRTRVYRNLEPSFGHLSCGHVLADSRAAESSGSRVPASGNYVHFRASLLYGPPS